MATNFINDILAQFGGNRKDCVCISVTPEVGVEVAQIDGDLNTVIKYGVRPIEYNEALKEIKDYKDLKYAINDLFSDLNISPKSSIILSIPTVHMGKIELPDMLNKDAIREAIISEVEQSYIFKRCEPMVSWSEIPSETANPDTKTFIYSAIQQPAFNALKEIVTSIGGTLDRLEISLTTTLRGLSYIGYPGEEVDESTSWMLMVVKSNGYELVQMCGNQIRDYYSEPLALKTYDMEEVYDAINASAQIALMSYPTNKLILLSETDLVSAEHLAAVMHIDGDIKFIENNEYKKQDLTTISLDILPEVAVKISLEAIGIASTMVHDYPTTFEFTGNKKSVMAEKAVPPLVLNINGKVYELAEETMLKISLALGAILIIPSIIAMIALSSAEKNAQGSLDEVNANVKKVSGEISALLDTSKDTEFDISKEIETVIQNNRAKLIAYSALGESVPKTLWLKYFKTSEDGKINIVGVSENVENIYVFYRNLKDSIIDSQLRLHKLEMESPSVDDALSSSSNYDFQITNISEEVLNAAEAPANKEKGDEDNKDKDNKSKGQTGGKSVKDLEEVEVH